jgi:hypothetical protein
LDSDGEADCLRNRDAGGDQHRSAGTDLGRGGGWADRQRCCCGSGAEKEERERERETDSERAEQEKQCQRSREPACRHERPGLRGTKQRGRARAHPAGEPEADEALTRRDPRQGDHERGGSDSGCGDQGQAGAQADVVVRKDGGGSRERRQSDAVDQPEHEE